MYFIFVTRVPPNGTRETPQLMVHLETCAKQGYEEDKGKEKRVFTLPRAIVAAKDNYNCRLAVGRQNRKMTGIYGHDHCVSDKRYQNGVTKT